MSTATIAPDILAAVIAFLRAAMAEDLGDTPAKPRVWSQYSPQYPYPYAVVTHLPEDLRAQSEAAGLSYVAIGALMVAFYATSLEQSMALAWRAMQLLHTPPAPLVAADSWGLEIFPARAESFVVGDTATDAGQAFVRAITFTYKRQFAEPWG